jgi:GGDEF domain-containing protein
MRVATEQRHELALRLVRLVDVQRLVGDQLGERVRDPVEQRVEALLREELVEDVRETTVGFDEPVVDRLGGEAGWDQPDQVAGEVEV